MITISVQFRQNGIRDSVALKGFITYQEPLSSPTRLHYSFYIMFLNTNERKRGSAPHYDIS